MMDKRSSIDACKFPKRVAQHMESLTFFSRKWKRKVPIKVGIDIGYNPCPAYT